MYIAQITRLHQAFLQAKDMDTDELLVRRELVRVWSKVLEKYARPGYPIPTAEPLRQELIAIGTDAGVDVLVREHWYLFDFMIQDEVRSKIENGLARFDIDDFLEDVKETQKNPQRLGKLKEKIRKYVLEEF